MRPAQSRVSEPPPFRCARSGGDAAAVRIEASGELDLATAPELERALRDAVGVAPLVVLDLHALTFIDAAGLHVIENAGLSALLRGRRLVVTGAPAHVARIVALTGLSGTVDLLDVDAADADPSPGSPQPSRRRRDRCPREAARGRGAYGP